MRKLLFLVLIILLVSGCVQKKEANPEYQEGPKERLISLLERQDDSSESYIFDEISVSMTKLNSRGISFFEVIDGKIVDCYESYEQYFPDSKEEGICDKNGVPPREAFARDQLNQPLGDVSSVNYQNCSESFHVVSAPSTFTLISKIFCFDDNNRLSSFREQGSYQYGIKEQNITITYT